MSTPPPKRLTGRNTRPLHRIAGTLLLAFTGYFGLTGLIVQAVDLRAIFSHAAATDPEMQAIRESIDGTSNFIVIQPTDYSAPALPDDFDFIAAMPLVLEASRNAVGNDASFKYLEFRVTNGKTTGLVLAAEGSDARIVGVDPATGTVLSKTSPSPPTRPPASVHDKAKRWHRLQALGLGDLMEWVNGLVGIGLFVMVITGVLLYLRLLRARSRAGLKAFFWSVGERWRALHRSIAIVAAVFLIVVSVSGTLLSIDSFALGVYIATHHTPGKPGPQFPPGMNADMSAPLAAERLPDMLQKTLAAYRQRYRNIPIKVLRLRYFSGMAQGVIITGGADTRQVLFDATTGQRASMTEPGYPYTGFPFGWEEHELMKKIHRGDALGISGRLMDVFAGCSLVYLSISGLVMYLELWRRRRRAGRSGVFWK